jgi:hypothetical protein
VVAASLTRRSKRSEPRPPAPLGRIHAEDQRLLRLPLAVDHDEPLLASGLLPVDVPQFVAFPEAAQLDHVPLATVIDEEPAVARSPVILGRRQRTRDQPRVHRHHDGIHNPFGLQEKAQRQQDIDPPPADGLPAAFVELQADGAPDTPAGRDTADSRQRSPRLIADHEPIGWKHPTTVVDAQLTQRRFAGEDLPRWREADIDRPEDLA